MTSKRKRARRYLRWTRYQHRIDKLTTGQWTECTAGSAMRCNQGFFRAEGWDTRGRHRVSLGHGA